MGEQAHTASGWFLCTKITVSQEVGRELHGDRN
jgi:hypothetical protein